MEKALHDYFYINTGKEIKLYSDKESSFLIEAANFQIERLRGNNSPGTIPALDALIFDCMVEYYKNGLSDDLLNKLNKVLTDAKIQRLVKNCDNKLIGVDIAYMPYNNTDPLVFGAYMFHCVTSLGGLEKLKRCQNIECVKFFISRTNAKWCTSSCGSKCRVKKMRKNKRNMY